MQLKRSDLTLKEILTRKNKISLCTWELLPKRELEFMKPLMPPKAVVLESIIIRIAELPIKNHYKHTQRFKI